MPPGARLSHDIIVINIHLIARWWYSFCNKIYTGRTHIHAFIRPYLTICLCLLTLSCDYFMIVLKLPSTGFVLPQHSVLLYRLFCNHKIELWNALTLCFFVSHFHRLVINSTTPTLEILFWLLSWIYVKRTFPNCSLNWCHTKSSDNNEAKYKNKTWWLPCFSSFSRCFYRVLTSKYTKCQQTCLNEKFARFQSKW